MKKMNKIIENANDLERIFETNGTKIVNGHVEDLAGISWKVIAITDLGRKDVDAYIGKRGEYVPFPGEEEWVDR